MAKIKVTKIENIVVDCPAEEDVITFLAHRGWIRVENMPKYRKNDRVVNLKFMTDLVDIVADVEGIDSYTVVKLINEMGRNK